MAKHGSVQNQIYGTATIVGEPTPEVGMGATMVHWTDREPFTIIKVTPKTIEIQRDRVKAKAGGPYPMGHQEWDITPDPQGATYIVRLKKDGRWMCASNRVLIGRRENYHDWSF